jgi:hypothetical protein
VDLIELQSPTRFRFLMPPSPAATITDTCLNDMYQYKQAVLSLRSEKNSHHDSEFHRKRPQITEGFAARRLQTALPSPFHP